MGLVRHNSLIRIKSAICKGCGKYQPIQAVGLCQNCYQQSLKLKCYNKAIANSTEPQDGFPELRDELDTVFSRWVRMSAADETGQADCFICGSRHRWQDMDNAHFVSRGNMFLRYDPRNCKCCCRTCNQYLDGNLILYAQRLNQTNIGITDVLLEESRLVYHFGRAELQNMISEYTIKVNKLKSKLKP